MNYVKYNRSFVMMEEQSKDFSTREAPVKGYLKVETGNNKGALRCVVQNLKYYGRGDYIYKLILFGKKKEKTIHNVLGSLIINRYGNGETYFRFDPLNVDGKGNRYDDFTVAIVAAVSSTNDKEALHPVLKGVMRNENASFRQEERYIDNEEEEMKREYDEDKHDNEEKKQEEQYIEPIEHIEEKEHCEVGDTYEQSGTIERREEVREKKTAPRGVYNYYYNEHLLQFCGHTCRVAGYYEEVIPFEADQTGARWKKIQNVGTLPLVSPGAHYFATQYKHYLFGAKPDPNGLAQEYFFAVPGRFTQEEQPDGGRSGFVYWQPVAGAPHTQASYGYWILAVDARTGDILEVCT